MILKNNLKRIKNNWDKKLTKNFHWWIIAMSNLVLCSRKKNILFITNFKKENCIHDQLSTHLTTAWKSDSPWSAKCLPYSNLTWKCYCGRHTFIHEEFLKKI